jgi:hypothetical protein
MGNGEQQSMADPANEVRDGERTGSAMGVQDKTEIPLGFLRVCLEQVGQQVACPDRGQVTRAHVCRRRDPTPATTFTGECAPETVRSHPHDRLGHNLRYREVASLHPAPYAAQNWIPASARSGSQLQNGVRYRF